MLFAPHQAYDFLEPRFADASSGVQLRRIPGLRFVYKRGNMHLTKSVVAGMRFWATMGPLVKQLVQCMRDEKPDLVITDFEPLLPRAAQRVGIPYVSVDHQHVLTACDLSALPRSLRMSVFAMRWAIDAHYRRQVATIATAFYHPPLLDRYPATLLVDPIVRQTIREAEVTTGDYLVSYLRPHTPPTVMDMLRDASCPMRVYGLGERPPSGNMEFRDFHPQRFVEDLAGCRAMVGAAGNQSLSESLYLGKPVLALPESSHFEQRINAFYLQHMGYGRSVDLDRFTATDLSGFLENLDGFQVAQKRGREGNPAVLEAINRLLDP